MRRRENVWVLDLETRNSKAALDEGKTWCWLWAAAPIWSPSNATVGNSIESFFDFAKKNIKNGTIYTHNFRFDGAFILDFLLKSGYTSTLDKRIDNGQCNCLIGDNGLFYCVKVRMSSRCTLEFRDSFKKIPMKVSEIPGAFGFPELAKLREPDDYQAEHLPGETIEPEAAAYVCRDVEIVCRALQVYYANGHAKMTISADAWAEFLSIYGGKMRFRRHFPELPAGAEKFCRRAFAGGASWVKGDVAGVEQGACVAYDINSGYAAEMVNNYYPFGDPIPFRGEPPEDMPEYILHVRCCLVLKPDHVPCLRVTNDILRNPNAPVESALDNLLDLYLTRPDWELVQEQYDVIYCDYIGGYAFYRYHGSSIFGDFIKKYYEIKKQASGGERYIAKRFLVAIFGKMATMPDRASKLPYYDAKDKRVRYNTVEASREALYIPVSAYITAYQRCTTIRAAQANYDRLLSLDTDCIWLMGKEPPIGIKVDPVELGAWKIEHDAENYYVVRAKTYWCIEGGELVLKASGMTEDAKTYFREGMRGGPHAGQNPIYLDGKRTTDYDITAFRPGLEIRGHNLRGRIVDGGMILEPNNYQMQDPLDASAIWIK